MAVADGTAVPLAGLGVLLPAVGPLMVIVMILSSGAIFFTTSMPDITLPKVTYVLLKNDDSSPVVIKNCELPELTFPVLAIEMVPGV